MILPELFAQTPSRASKHAMHDMANTVNMLCDFTNYACTVYIDLFHLGKNVDLTHQIQTL